MDYYNQIDPYDQEQLPYQPRQPHQTEQARAPRQYMERPLFDRPRSATPPRMPKAKALALVQQCKKWLVVASLIGFGVLTGLVVNHTTGVTSTSAQQQQPGDNTIQQRAPAQSQDDGGFFQQQQQPQGGYGLGPNSTQQPPVSGTRTS